MQNPRKSDKATHEVGRIYDAITDSKVLIDFFLQTVLRFIPAQRGFLFLAGTNKKLWLENATFTPKQASDQLTGEAQKAFEIGKPCVKGERLFLPLIACNSSIGIACFERAGKKPAFTEKEVETGFDLASEFSGALKSILLFEENLKMERLAAVGQAMGMVIHEIRNIMQLAFLSKEMVQMGVEERNEEFLKTGLKKIEKTLHEMNGFILEMLSLTKDYQLEPENVDVPALLEELKNDLGEKAERYHTGLDFQAEKNFPIVQGDGRSIYRALLNLVKNAFEAFPQDHPKACVKVRARVLDNEKYEITVEDNASGMSEEVRARLFETFFSTKGKNGTGLGLMVVSRTMNMHHGSVNVESRLGSGTKFILTFPRSFSKN